MATDSSVDPGRDSRGRFKLGNSGGPGNPLIRRQYALRRELTEAATPEIIKAIGHKLLQMTFNDGDIGAARLYLEYTLGKPSQDLSISGPDGEPLGVDRFAAAVLEALAPFSEARVAVGLKLKEMALVDESNDAE